MTKTPLSFWGEWAGLGWYVRMAPEGQRRFVAEIQEDLEASAIRGHATGGVRGEGFG